MFEGALLSGGGGTTGGMDAVTASISTLISMVGDLLTAMTSNSILCIFLAGSVLGVGLVIFKKLKGAAKS